MDGKSIKKALITSIFIIALCVVMLIGATFAWFTDIASTGVNKIESGNLKVGIYTKDANGRFVTAEGKTLNFVAADGRTEIYWEPGCTYELPELFIKNDGNLAVKYKMKISGITGDGELNDVIEWKVNGEDIQDAEYHLEKGAVSDAIKLSGHMIESAGNHYQSLYISGVSITVYATQDAVEADSIDNKYDIKATYPVTTYDEFKEAFSNGGIITVAKDISIDKTKSTAADRLKTAVPSTISLDNKLIFDGELEPTDNWAGLWVLADTVINAGENGGIICKDKTAGSSYTGGPFGANILNGATLTINGGEYYAGGTVVQVTKGTLVVNGGFFSCAPDIGTNDYRYLLNCIDANYNNGTAKIIVTGGTFVNFDPSNNAAEGVGTNFVKDGYKVVSEAHGSDTWYTVVPK